MSLVGRDVELARIQRLLTNARDARSGVLALRGAAGIGKSVLLDHAVSIAEAEGMQVVRGAGIESDSELAYGGLHQLLFSHLDRLGALPTPQATALRCAFGLAEGDDANRFLISAGTLSLLADLAEDSPLLCVVDDLQWLDEGSVEALLFAARRFVADPIAVLFAVRETSVPVVVAGVEVVDLSGLAAPDAARLLDDHAPQLAERVRTRVLAESGGNPLAIIELGSSRDVDEFDPAEQVGPLPVTRRVQEAFRRQIVELPEPTHRALLVAAADTAAPLATALHVIESLGGAAGDLAPAERDRLVRIDSRITFRHPLVRAAAYQDAPLHRRIEVHRAYAEALRADADADRRAWHLAAATTKPDEAVAAELEGVAERAWHRGGAMAVCAAYERAGRLSADRELKARRIVRASQAAFDAGKADRAARLAAEALALSADTGVRADAIYTRGAVEYERTSPRADAELTLEAAALVRDTDPERAALTLYEAAHAARHGAAHDLLQRAADLMRGFTPPEHWAPVVAALLGWAELFAGRPELAVGPMRDLHTATRGGGHDLMRRITAGFGGLMIADDDCVIAGTEDMLAVVRATGALGWVPYTLNVLAVARLLRGEFADARACVAEGVSVSDELGNTTESLAHRSVEVWLHAVSGDEARCRALAEEVLPRARARHRVNAEIAAWGLGMLDLSARRFGDAVDRLEQVSRGPASRDLLVRAVPDLVEAAVRGGMPDRAHGPLAAFRHWAEHVDRPVATGLVLRCRALLADDGDADALYAEALRLHERHGGPYERARTRLVYGEWLRRQRRRTEARAHLAAAVSAFERLGARLWAERARGELAAFGERGDEPQRSGPLTLLTPQELQVVRLAATGHTNKEIAAQLFLSPRTVGHHLYKAYPKLGVTGRAELAHLV
ncbi:helix-turn-helix transcriptional regulator [Kibdelosporangium aridum]|uniref:Helix-turn-helix transcriptional regulator n=1 Tax=Kibdelosporangium aridum TaxID=2030 RepID=A0A428ZCL0_KIBAR|nr:LuxR family transcriptional regulator [Kibdelosporangium aridum]RSM85710.1 helix-turn-helix transcriptional regulator [Kibdelosporangium aridum]